jgi:hypothetical protein
MPTTTSSHHADGLDSLSCFGSKFLSFMPSRFLPARFSHPNGFLLFQLGSSSASNQVLVRADLLP